MATPHFKIGIDFDDVLVSTADRTIELYNQTYDAKVNRNDWYKFDDLPRLGVSSLSEIVDRVVDLHQTDGFKTVKPLKDAQSVLRKLKDAGHTLIVVTGRPENIRTQTVELLKRNYPGIFGDDDLYFTDHFGHAAQRTSKGDVALSLHLTYFIDDVIQHANEVSEKGVKTILFSDNYPWNQNSPNKEVVRFNSWREIGDFFDDEQRRAG